ncbi:MAG: DUF4139 domain-containing protein [Kofleriaceae bacterium]
MHRRCRFVVVALGLAIVACAHPRGARAPAPTPLHLERVVLYQNGIGHFERRGLVTDGHLRLVVRPAEVDDVIKTLTVVDRAGVTQQVAATLPTVDDATPDRVVIDVQLSQPTADVVVAYAVPTAAWKTTYRLTVPRQPGAPVQFQSWALIDNLTEEPWPAVRLALATGAPLSYATDLRTPHLVTRPDATGALVGPTARGVVTSTSARPGDRDGDGILDAADACPTDAEDLDGFEDDGCPDPDNDGDRIPDVDDRCPNEPESYNGFDDDDGCPDRGRVVVTAARLEILERVYFGPGAVTPSDRSGPILDAVAATLIGNPQLTTVAVAGHAAADEADPWGLSARRAAAVRAALAARGVTQAIQVRALGASQPDGGEPARDRRVEFDVHAAPPAAAPPAAAAAPTDNARAIDVAGTTQWELADRVTIPHATSSLVSVLGRPLDGGTVLLFRPDHATPGSSDHPYRAVRVALPADLSLEPGPVAVFADDSFAGEGVLTRTAGGRTTYVPYALDGGTRVAVEVGADERPQRLVAIARGVARVANTRVKKTRYRIAAGAAAPATLYLRHVPTAGYELGDLPPGSERADDHVLVAVPLTPGKDSVVEIDERQPVTRELHLLDDATDLVAYVDGPDLPPSVLAAAHAVTAARAALADVARQTAEAQEALGDAAARVDDLEASLTTVAKLPGAEAATLRSRLTKNLTAAVDKRDQLARTITGQRAAEALARVRLQTAIEALALEHLDAPAKTAPTP